MSRFSGWFLLLGAALTSPALFAALWEGSMAVDVALTRLLIAVGACWLAWTLLADIVWPQQPHRVLVDESGDAETMEMGAVEE